MLPGGVRLAKLVAERLHPAQLGGADGGVVGRVGEEDGPAVLDPAVEVNVALSGVSTEVGDWGELSAASSGVEWEELDWDVEAGRF